METLDNTLVRTVVNAKNSTDALINILKDLYPGKINFDNTTYLYESITPIIKNDENTNPNLEPIPTHYKINFTNGKSITIPAGVYSSVERIIQTLESHKNTINNLKVSDFDKNTVKNNASIYQRASAPSAGGNARRTKKGKISKIGKKNKISKKRRKRMKK